MKILLLIIFTSLLTLTGCVGFFETSSTAETKDEPKSKQQKAEKAVEAHILKSFGSLGTYKGFKFGELYTLKPKEIVELEQLYQIKKELPSLKENYPNKLDELVAENDSLILAKKKEIKKKNIYPTYEITHIFKITSKENTIKLFESKFTLFPDYKVKDVQILMNTELSKKEDELFYYFLMQYPLYDLENSITSNRLNKETYTQLNKALEKETENKARLLKTVLEICKYIRVNNSFDETDFSKKVIKKWIENNENYSINYKPIGFSDLFPLEESILNEKNDTVKMPIGYKLLHKFESETKDKSLIERTFRFTFDLNFVIIDIAEIVTDEKD